MRKAQLVCDVAIIGGGISTLYYLLTETDKDLVLFEKSNIASRDTGHNTGIAVAHIEKRLP